MYAHSCSLLTLFSYREVTLFSVQCPVPITAGKEIHRTTGQLELPVQCAHLALPKRPVRTKGRLRNVYQISIAPVQPEVIIGASAPQSHQGQKQVKRFRNHIKHVFSPPFIFPQFLGFLILSDRVFQKIGPLTLNTRSANRLCLVNMTWRVTPVVQDARSGSDTYWCWLYLDTEVIRCSRTHHNTRFRTLRLMPR